MTEQRLLDYEYYNFEYNRIKNDIRELNAKRFSINSTNFERVGTAQTTPTDERLVANLEKITELNKSAEFIKSEYEAIMSDFSIVFSCLNPIEIEYTKRRYMEAKTNKAIATDLHCSVRKIYLLRMSVLKKIKNL